TTLNSILQIAGATTTPPTTTPTASI
ncbi:flagellar hook assembly protein FlgD, partial [Aeromonas salmonicida subsp. achromogenes]